jgi:hypothetical protein
MCIDRDHRPAVQRRGRRAAGWWRRSWWRQALDGPCGRGRSPTVHAGGAAGDAGGPPADGGSASADADGQAQHARDAAQHAEHPAAPRGNARWRHGWHERHGPSAGAKLPAAQRGIAATAEPCATLVAQRRHSAPTRRSVTRHRVATGARFNPPIGSFARPRPGRSSGRSWSPRSGRRDRSHAAVAGSDARSSWLRRGAGIGEQARWRIRHEAGAAAWPGWRWRRWSTGCQHAPRPDREPAWSADNEALVPEPGLPGSRWRIGRRQSPGTSWPWRRESSHHAARHDRR